MLHPMDEDDSDLGSTAAPNTWGNLRSGNHFKMRRQALETWRRECWKKNYRLCCWGPVGVMPDLVLSKLASFNKIKTVNDLLKAASDWDYANVYGNEVFQLLKDADEQHRFKSQVQRVRTTQLNKTHKMEDSEGGGERQGPGGLIHTHMIRPVVVLHINPTTRPQPSHSQPQQILISCPYTHTDVFDSLINNSRYM